MRRAPGGRQYAANHSRSIWWTWCWNTPAAAGCHRSGRWTGSVSACRSGEILGLVGESGSGKSTIGRAVASLLPVTGGSIKIAGTEIKGLTQKQLMPMRRKVAIVFQDPASSLNPRMTIGESIGEPLFLHEKLRKGALAGRVEQLLDSVRLRRDYRYRYPHELSGGQRQRVGIARALSLGPELLVADEPTSALDVSVQAHVLELFKDLQAQYGFACLFISHDLAVVEILAKQIAVLHRGKLAEIGSRERILRNPQDPYTKRLLAAAPVPDPTEQGIRREERRALLAAGADQDEAVPFNTKQWDPPPGMAVRGTAGG